MRKLRHLLCLALLPLSGCFILVADCGIKPHALRTREEVHRTFGQPDTTDTVNDTYVTRRKLSDARVYSEGGHGLAYGMAFGLSGLAMEVMILPYELSRLAYFTAVGRELKFTYDAGGKVTEVFMKHEQRLTRPPE